MELNLDGFQEFVEKLGMHEEKRLRHRRWTKQLPAPTLIPPGASLEKAFYEASERRWDECIKSLTKELGSPSFRGEVNGTMIQSELKLDPLPDDFYHMLFLSIWNHQSYIAYVSVTGHDADTLMFLNIELIFADGLPEK